MSEVSYLRYENEKNSSSSSSTSSSSSQHDKNSHLYEEEEDGNRRSQRIDEEVYEDDHGEDGEDGEEELNTNEKILTSIYLQSTNRKKYHHNEESTQMAKKGNTPLISSSSSSTLTVDLTGTGGGGVPIASDSLGGETDNDSEKDANHALAAIHISDPMKKFKRDNRQSPSPLTDDANGSIDSPDSLRMRLHHDTIPSQITKYHTFDQHEPTPIPRSNSNPSAFTKQSIYRKSQENYQQTQHNGGTTSGSNSSVSYPSQLYNHRPSSTPLGNLNLLPSSNPPPSSTHSFLTDDFLLLTPSQQVPSPASAPSTNSSNSSSYLLTPLIPPSSSNSNDSLHSLQLENQSNPNKYPTFPSSTPHSVSELYYPLRDLTSLTPNTTSVPSTVSGQSVNSRSSPLQATSSSRKQSMAQYPRAGRGKAHASNQNHAKNIHAGANNSLNKSYPSSSVPPGASNMKLNNIQNDKRSVVPSSALSSSSLPMNSSAIPETSIHHNSAPSPVPNFNNVNMTPTQQSSLHNGPTFSSNMATIQQVKKKFSSVVKSSGAGENGNTSDLLMSSINGFLLFSLLHSLYPGMDSSLNGSNIHSQLNPPGMSHVKPAKTTQRKSRKMLSHPGTRLERSVSDLGTSDHLYNDLFASFDPDHFHFSSLLDPHLNDGFKPEIKNRSLSWQHSGSTGKSSMKSKGEKKSLKSGMKISGPSLHLSTSTPDFGDLSNGLENIFNQPLKKKRTSKGAKFRMFTRVWVPAFNVAGCITQEKNGGWKYVQFDTGLPLPLPNSVTSNSTTPQSSPRLLTKGLLDGKWCRACDMEEIPDGSSTAPGNGLNGPVKDHHSFPSNHSSIRHDLYGDDSDAEFDGDILGIADSFGFTGNPFFAQTSNHGDLVSDDDFGSLPMNNSSGPSSSHVPISSSNHDTTPILTDDLDQLDSFLMKRRRDRSDSLDLLNTNLNDRDAFMTFGMNTKSEDSIVSGGKNNSTTGGVGGGTGGLGIGGAGMLDDVSWHNIEYSGINLDDCDWNL